LSSAPRPQKEAAVACAAGFKVTILGVWWSDQLAKEDVELAESIGVEFRPVVDLRNGKSLRFCIRLKQRIARDLFRWTGLVSPRILGTGAPEILREALRIRADLTMVHSEVGLWVAEKLLRHVYNVGVDFEDWFSQDLLPEDRVERPVVMLQRLERTLLHKANLTLTTTGVMAEALAQDASCDRIPETIPNCFSWDQAPHINQTRELCDERDPAALSLYWFSQTIGPGRGLETLAQALLELKGSWQLHLRGELRNHRAWFDAAFPETLRDRVVLHECTSNQDLPAKSVSHDVGLALEIPYSQNKDLTASNKIFEYLRCGLAVVATDTRGQLEVMNACPEAGWIVPSGDVDALRLCLQHLLDGAVDLRRAKKKALEAAAGPWAWENHALHLKELLLSVVKD